MQILLDGWSIFLEYKEAIFILCVTVWGLGEIGAGYLCPRNDENRILGILITLATGMLLLTWTCILLVLLGRLWLPLLTFGSLFLPAGCALFLFASRLRPRASKIGLSGLRVGLTFLSATFIYSLARLAFLKELLLPPYDDSPEHYLIIRDLLQLNGGHPTTFYSLDTITAHYYHMGFHALTAWLTIASQSDPAMLMAFMGQVFIVISALAIFLLTYVWTGNSYAALVATLFAAFAWRMPAFAANWGKYPAMAGLALLPAWLGVWLVSQGHVPKKFVSVLLFLSTVGLGLMHTRLFICQVIIAIAWFISGKLSLNWPSRLARTAVPFFASTVVLLIFVQAISVYYSNDLYIALGILVLLLPFAVHAHSRLVVAICLSMFGIWLASQTPVFFGAYGTNWLDAPFIELLLYIPLSLLAGLSFSGFLNTLEIYPKLKIIAFVIPAVLLATAFVSAEGFYPDPCCNYVTRGDLAAIDWLQQNAPADAVVWISGFKPNNYMIATDAGVWITALSGHNANKLGFDFDWEASKATEKICQPGYQDAYIYVGSTVYSFSEVKIASSRLFDLVFERGKTRIFHIRCAPPASSALRQDSPAAWKISGWNSGTIGHD